MFWSPVLLSANRWGELSLAANCEWVTLRRRAQTAIFSWSQRFSSPEPWCCASDLSPWFLSLTVNQWGRCCFGAARRSFEFYGPTCLFVKLVSLFLEHEPVCDVLYLSLGLYYPSLTQDQDNKSVECRTDSWVRRQEAATVKRNII